MTTGDVVRSRPTVAVVTVTYNSARTLERFWSGHANSRFEWIVVDNASTDDSVAVAQALGARVIRLPDNRGFSAANNAGVASTSADVVLFCNPDVAVTDEGALALARRVMDEGGILAPQLLNVDGSDQENGRGAPYVTSKIRHLLRLHDAGYARIAKCGETIDVVWVMGAALAMRRSDFDRISGWDAGFFIYYEDADICLRARESGMPVRVDGSVRWTHGWARETGRGFSLRAWRFELKAAMRFYFKHPYCLVPIGRRSRAVGDIAGTRAVKVAA